MNHKDRSAWHRCRGFTLMEMLAVIVIICILMTVSMGVYKQVRNVAWKGKTRDSARQIATAWNLSLLENQSFPLAALAPVGTVSGSYLTFQTTTNTMMILNSSKIYLEQSADQKRNGMKDKWGHCFNVQIDQNYGGTVEDPANPSAPKINANVVVWSYGPNGPGDTNNYCVASP